MYHSYLLVSFVDECRLLFSAIAKVNFVLFTAKLDPARLVMCLQSGLLCESIWAIDSITIMLQDENTCMYLSLVKMPGLLDSLLAHYKYVSLAPFKILHLLSYAEIL